MKTVLGIALLTGFALLGCAHKPRVQAPKVTDPDCYCHRYDDTGEMVPKCVRFTPEGDVRIKTLYGKTCSR